MTLADLLAGADDATRVSVTLGAGDLTIGDLRAAFTRSGPTLVTTEEASKRYGWTPGYWRDVAKKTPGALKDRWWRIPVEACRRRHRSPCGGATWKVDFPSAHAPRTISHVRAGSDRVGRARPTCELRWRSRCVIYAPHWRSLARACGLQVLAASKLCDVAQVALRACARDAGRATTGAVVVDNGCPSHRGAPPWRAAQPRRGARGADGPNLSKRGKVRCLTSGCYPLPHPRPPLGGRGLQPARERARGESVAAPTRLSSRDTTKGPATCAAGPSVRGGGPPHPIVTR